ncbi:MAG: YceI family protein [Sporichthyaceae bacterium]
MNPEPGTVEIGPTHGTLRVFTTREGVAAAVGHDLEIGFARWSGTLDHRGEPLATAVAVTVELDSFSVIAGSGGVSPLSDSDRADIRRNALKVLDTEGHPTAEFRSTKVAVDSAGNGCLTGTLSMAERDVGVRFEIRGAGPGTWHATGEVAQTALGLKPYRAFLGALRLSDTVRIEVEVKLALPT